MGADHHAESALFEARMARAEEGAEKLKCTFAGCDAEPTKVLAMPPRAVPCVMVNPYCDEHAEGILKEGGWFATGDALAPEFMLISGVRR